MKKRFFAHSFWEEYQARIKPVIAEIDIFLKTADYPLDIMRVAYLLDLDETEIQSILADTNHNSIGKAAFMDIMLRGSSPICQMYAREVEIGSPHTYSASQLSYVYNLDLEDVKNVCQKLQIREATPLTMPMIFANIKTNTL